MGAHGHLYQVSSLLDAEAPCFRRPENHRDQAPRRAFPLPLRTPAFALLFTFYFSPAFMIPLQLSFEEAISQSYQLYQEKGPRSPEKLRPLHGWFAETPPKSLGSPALLYSRPQYRGRRSPNRRPLLSQTRGHSYSFQERGSATGCS